MIKEELLAMAERYGMSVFLKGLSDFFREQANYQEDQMENIDMAIGLVEISNSLDNFPFPDFEKEWGIRKNH